MKAWIALLLVALFSSGCAGTEDLPCIPLWEDAGQSYMCVCNSTYCDTVNRPTKSGVGSGSYFYYKTSNSTPGFTRTKGKFYSHAPDIVNEVTFTIDSNIEYQEIVGFGGSVTDSVGSVFNTLLADTQEKLLESYFGSTGIEYSMMRIPIGSTDFSMSNYTLDDVPYDNDLQNFDLNDADYNLKIPLLQKIIEMSEKDIKIIACTWIAPSWMKDGDSPYNTFIKQEYEDAWARYHVKFVQAYHENGINIWGLSSPNEPMLLFLLPFGGGFLNFTVTLAPEQRSWMKDHLKPQLAANNLSDVKFFALEDVRPFAAYFMERFALDPEAYAALDGIAIHSYFDWFWPAFSLDEMHYKYPDKLLLYTENSINDEFGFPALVLGSWYHAEVYLANIFENLGHFVQSYIDWNLALNTDGGPTRSQALDCAVLINETSGEFYKQPIFYAMGHFSKFVLPGAKRVDVTSNTATKAESTSKAEQSLQAAKTLKSVSEGIAFNITIPQEISCLAFTNPDDSFTVMVLNTKNITVPVKIVDSRVGVITLKAEQQSINTFVYWPSSTDSLTEDSI